MRVSMQSPDDHLPLRVETERAFASVWYHRSDALRPDRRARRARAQPQERRRRDPARPADRDHRPVRLRQVQPCLRHHLRRGPAPLCRVAVRLCAAVPGPDGEAGRRPDRRAVAGDQHRPEGRLAEPALDGRHRHRDLRLPAPAVRARRPHALPDLRSRDRRARPWSRWSTRSTTCPTARGSCCWRRSCAIARASTRSCWRAPSRAASCACGSMASCATWTRRSSSTRSTSTASRSWSTAWSCAGPMTTATPAPDGSRMADSIETALRLSDGNLLLAPARCTEEGAGAALQRAVRLPRARRLVRGACAAQLLFNSPARRLPGLHRTRLAAGDRPGPGDPGRVAVARRAARCCPGGGW